MHLSPSPVTATKETPYAASLPPGIGGIIARARMRPSTLDVVPCMRLCRVPIRRRVFGRSRVCFENGGRRLVASYNPLCTFLFHVWTHSYLYISQSDKFLSSEK